MIKHILPLLFVFFLIMEETSVDAETMKPLDISLKIIDGRMFKLSDFKGKKPVYLKFWASWCQPCRKQMPHLQCTFEKYGSEIEVIAVNIAMNDTDDAIKQTIKAFSLSLPVVIDENSSLSQAFNLIATPYHVLLDKNGTIVHQGHNASAELDEKIRLLSKPKTLSLPEVKLAWTKALPLDLNLDEQKSTLLFFSSAWCDWYLKNSRPVMSENCVNAQKLVNSLYEKYPGLNWVGVLTRLWTDDKALNEYQEKYNIKYPLFVDDTNSAFLTYAVQAFPVLIGIKNGEEVFRFSDFSDQRLIESKFKSLSMME